MKTLIVDGNNSAHRLYHKLPTLTANGNAIQVVYGFLRLLKSSISQFEPDAVLVCWDKGRSAYRKRLYPEYKATRTHDKTEAEKQSYKSILAQIQILRDTLELLNIASVEFPETEADDLIGIATQCLKGEKIIVTSDQDALHLVDDSVSVWSPIKGQHYTRANFNKVVGVNPQQFLELRALTGDTSDNIEGVAKGFGTVTAKELIAKYGSMEKLFSSAIAEKLEKRGGRYALLYSEGAKNRAYRNMLLMDLRLCQSQPEGAEQVKLIWQKVARRHRIDKMAVRKYFVEQKFQSLLEQFAIWIKPFEDLDHG